MRLFVIRHATPEPGSAAVPDGERVLSALGREEAARLARAVAGERLDRVISSTMRRAVETAQPVAEALGLPLILEPELAEIDIGALSAWGPDEEAEWERVAACWAGGDLEERCPGGESLSDVAARVEPAISRLLATRWRHGIAVVAHSVVNGVVVSTLCPELEAPLGHDLGHSCAGIWELEGEGREFRLVRRDDVSHLIG